ncbi:restriction endonuclease subunit S [Flavobacteriaceae bacterium LMO-SS05]
MRSNYKIIGDFIRQVNIKNDDVNVELLLGVNLDKKFMPSVANIHGTDMANYKIIKKGQFGCKLMSVGRDKKLPISRLTTYDEALISSAYFVFEVVDENELLPEYLMMWFLRPESDRFLWFLSGGDIRGRITWEDLCSLPINVPSIGKQQEIVNEYNTITNRIALNEQLNQKLEETAQALYKHWFVDFNFPISKESYPELVSGSPHLEGKPYKSSGGKMIWCDELDKEIPKGWEADKWDKYVKLSQGQVINSKTRYLVVEKGLPLLKITDLFNGTATMFIDPEKVSKKNIATKNDLIYSRTGQVGYVFRNKEGVVYNNCFKVIPINNLLSKELVYWYLKDENIRRLMIDLASGSAQADLTHSAFFSVSVVKPQFDLQKKFSKASLEIVKKIHLNDQMNILLNDFKNLLLSKMTKVEVEKEIA